MRSEQSMMRNDSTGVRLKRQVFRNCGILGRVVARFSLCAALLLVLDALIGASYDPCFAAQRRSALLIGNAAYQREPLPNAVNDVRALGTALRSLGFDVIVIEDAGSGTIRDAVAVFSKRLQAGGLGLFYYSGRGLQVDGADHLVPVDADIASEASVRLEAIGVEDIIDAMSKPRPDRMNVLILDTCRNAPYSDRRGGAAIDDVRRRQVPPDLLVVQATERGSIALDTGAGHGLYTEELLKAIAATGGLPSMATLDRIAAAVGTRTAQVQVPQATAWLARGFDRVAYADHPSASAVTLDAPGEVRLTAHRGIRSSGPNPDVVMWESIKNSRNAADYEAYLKAFPNGQFVGDARARADKYRRPVQPKAPAPQPKAPAPQIEETDTYVTLGVDSNVREEPRATSKRIATVTAGTPVHVTGQVKGTNWYRVEAKAGVSGFVFGERVAQAEAAAPTPTEPAAHRAAATTWELLTPFASDSFETRNLEQFVNEIDEATNGGFKIVVLSTPSMRSSDIKQTVQAGRAPAGEFFLSEAGAGREAAFEVDLLPFLATTYDEALALWDASRPVLQPLLEADGLHLAFVVAHPPRGLFIDKEVWKMSDLRGVRILDDHPMTAKLATLAGAVPVQKPQGALAQAFAGDGIDAMIASIPTGIAENAWTFVSDYYDLRVALPKSVVAFNRSAYAALDPEIQRAVLNAAVAAQNRGWSTSAAANNDGIDLLRSKGMTVAAPPAEVVDRLKQIGASMTRDWAQLAGDAGQAILGQYRRVDAHAEQ
jgi:TRAP-type C4-dicarboxylate transport system substrate-binding protein